MATRRAAKSPTFAEIDNVGPEQIAQFGDDVVHLANAIMVEEDLGSAVGDSPGTAGGVASIWHYARP